MLPRRLRHLANEASGRPGRASSSVELVTAAARRSQRRPRRRARSNGLSRSLTDNSGRSQALSCAIDVAPGHAGCWGAPFKLGTVGPHRGHSRATSGRIAADNSGQHRPTICRGHRAHSPTRRRSPRSPEISDTEAVMGAALGHHCRDH